MQILVITHFLNGFLMIAIPVGLGLFLNWRFHLGWRLWGIGAATFVISQVGHLPFNWILNRLFVLGMLPSPPAAWRIIIFSAVGGLSAGLWEELARAGTYRWWADDARSWRKGLLLGAGHGGIEAIILGVLVLIGFVNMLLLSGPDAARLVPPEQMGLVKQQLATYWSGNGLAALMGAVERVFAIINHLALSLLVLQAFTRKQPAWIALAVLWHATADGVMGYFVSLWGAQPWGMLAIEGIIAASALVSLGIIFALRQPEPLPETAPWVDEAGIAPGEQAPEPGQISEMIRQQPEVEINEDHLDQSRYST